MFFNITFKKYSHFRFAYWHFSILFLCMYSTQHLGKKQGGARGEGRNYKNMLYIIISRLLLDIMRVSRT